MNRAAQGCLTGVLAVLVAGPALAQESKSAPLAKQLASALDAAKLDSIAARDPSNPDVYIGALYIPGFQLLTISGKYSAPVLLDTRLAKKEYRDVYIDLNSASVVESRVFVEDLGVDGLQFKREENHAFDSVETAGKRTLFDSDWKKQKLSEEAYMKAFTTCDQRYAEMLMVLIAQLKKGS
jgi:hypothetical protein